MSEGEYISLGWWEKDDLKTAIEFIRKTDSVSKIGLWGRSMGSVTAILHSARDPSLAGMVLDSPFSDLGKLIEEIGKRVMGSAPEFVTSMLLWFVKRSVKSRADFDVDEVTPLNYVVDIKIPGTHIQPQTHTLAEIKSRPSVVCQRHA